MQPPPSETKSSDDLLDLNLPVPDVPLWPFHDLPPDWTYAMNEAYAAKLPLDDAYWAWSLAGKNPEPFVM
jgi:hypothetical protein